MLETHLPEPIRSGLDKRSAHIVIIKHRYEYENWIRAMFEVCKDRFEHDNQGLTIQQQQDFALKSNGFYCHEWVVYCLEGESTDQPSPRGGLRRRLPGHGATRRLSTKPGPLCTGFANGTESVIAGSPSIMIFGQSYGNENRNLKADAQAWLHLVQKRIATKQVTPVAELLQMDTTQMLAAALRRGVDPGGPVEQAAGEVRQAGRGPAHNKDALAAIKDVYGWDEKKLTEEWHKFVLDQR